MGRIDAGTEVVVPFGAENTQRIGIVKACRFLTEQETPCSAEKAKHIIRKAARADFQPVETVPSMFDNSVNKYISLMSTLQQVAERKTMEANNEQTSVTEAHVMRSVNAKEDLPSAVTSYSTPSETPEKSLSAIGTPAPVSEETPIASDENLDHKIEFWKRELLDTGKRNKMINYKETKRATLRILEPEASELFNRLAFSDKPLTFQKPINRKIAPQTTPTDAPITPLLCP